MVCRHGEIGNEMHALSKNPVRLQEDKTRAAEGFDRSFQCSSNGAEIEVQRFKDCLKNTLRISIGVTSCWDMKELLRRTCSVWMTSLGACSVITTCLPTNRVSFICVSIM